jgi:hypothetical protein
MGSERKVVAPTSAETGQPVQISDQQLATGLEVFGRIADLWGLSVREREIVLGLPPSTYERWRASRVMSERAPHIEERLSYVVRIYAALATLLPLPDRATAWVKQPNTAPPFGGRSALDRMLGGRVGDLKAVADYLDGQV